MQLSLATHADLLANADRARRERSRSKADPNAVLGIAIACLVGLAMWTLIIVALWTAFA